MKIAIVTGASSGLGRDFVRQISVKEPDLNEIWVIARREERLQELSGQVNTKLRVLPADLTQDESIEMLKNLLEAEHPEVAILVNAAGFGKIGDYSSISRADCDAMINLNCRAAVDMTILCIPYMSRGSRILEVCSTAAFQPFQRLNIYAASKAFLYRYSRALGVELFPKGITVTAVCPYWVRDTEFIPVARQTGSKKDINHFPLASKSRTVVSWALHDSRIGLPVSTPGPVCMFHRIAAKFIPSSVMMAIWALLRRV